MDVLLVTTTMSKRIKDHARALKTKHRVHLLTLEECKPIPGVRVHIFPKPPLSFFFYSTVGKACIEGLLAVYDFDIIHSYDNLGFAFRNVSGAFKVQSCERAGFFTKYADALVSEDASHAHISSLYSRRSSFPSHSAADSTKDNRRSTHSARTRGK